MHFAEQADINVNYLILRRCQIFWVGVKLLGISMACMKWQTSNVYLRHFRESRSSSGSTQYVCPSLCPPARLLGCLVCVIGSSNVSNHFY